MNGERSLHKVIPVRGGAQKQSLVLNRFIVSHFIKGTLKKYAHLFETSIELEKRAIMFMETLLRRAHSTRLQFKTVCCIVIKFLEYSSQEGAQGTNYMRFLHNNFLKLLVAAFVLSVPNKHDDFGERLAKRDDCYAFYSRVTGLSLDEVANCSSIVRPVLIQQSRHQHKLRREQNVTEMGILRGSTYQGDCGMEDGYILRTEIEQFDRLGYKMVQEYFNII
ncbi:YPL039W [Zygosaccharomyces parabailii]|nr:YPL039W [Zygosaccharomyces parabailii]CDH14113.1 uncharacterized protein ZBAI_05899 [Zygosaccharomyces bailii ISA1307]SJM86268.1 uncharacterized protein ZBIST_2765 [Zygosaccharomyces bailii]